MSRPSPREIRLFVSYARADRDLVERLLEKLAPHLAILRDYRITRWIDHDLEPGEPWDPAIHAALEQADLGLMLLSPAFLASAYIAREELPAFIDLTPAGPADQTRRPTLRLTRPLLPVLLRDLPPAGGFDHRGFDQLQLFKDEHRRSFANTRGATADAFALELATALHAKLTRHYPASAA